MKKGLVILLAVALSLMLCACPALELGAASGTPQVHITVGEVVPGMTLEDVFVEVTIDNQPVPCRVKLTGFQWDGYWEMEADEPVPETFSVRVDIFYSLPKGCDVEDVEITMECDGGEYDGTGSISFDEAGNVEAWSQAFYGEEPLPPETETTLGTEAATVPATEPHAHSWTEDTGYVYIQCTVDSTKTYHCSCGETKTETVPAPGHDMRAWSGSEPTCTEDGCKTASCKRCGAGFTVETPATGHSWSEWVNENGRQHKHTCSVCGEEEYANHNIPADSVTCTDCGADIIN